MFSWPSNLPKIIEYILVFLGCKRLKLSWVNIILGGLPLTERVTNDEQLRSTPRSGEWRSSAPARQNAVWPHFLSPPRPPKRVVPNFRWNWTNKFSFHLISVTFVFSALFQATATSTTSCYGKQSSSVLSIKHVVFSQLIQNYKGFSNTALVFPQLGNI
jgi:hypothetical protein